MALIIKNLFKKFDENWIIKDVSLEVKRGEILGIFGVVGVGKSTLLRAVAGNIEHDGGAIFFDAEDMPEADCQKRQFPLPNLTNDTFWKNVFKTETPSELSDGTGQALALEHSLQMAESVLLLDNQFCFMDSETREENCKKLRKTVKEKNLAVIFATNNYNEIFQICDRVAVLDDGEIKQTGTPREVYENPNSAIVARVTGRNNLIESEYLESGNSKMPEFETIEGNHRLHAGKFIENSNEESGKNVTLAIRPEHISISFGASFPGDNLLKAKITGINYLGATTLIELDAQGLTLHALVLRLVGLQIGDECMVGLPPNRIFVFRNLQKKKK
ncbi:MAG TPA: ABC transporter ATP-binding protein [Pyrinomonadaceae bacterium]|nr:ABC transporter ATP-binding protein [Pyrinomonadaceae bacterium]